MNDFSKGSLTYYDILGLHQTSNESEVRKAYQQLALKYHPDQSQESRQVAVEKFQKIAEAYAILSDDSKRTLYDFYQSNRSSIGNLPFNNNNYIQTLKFLMKNLVASEDSESDDSTEEIDYLNQKYKFNQNQEEYKDLDDLLTRNNLNKQFQNKGNDSIYQVGKLAQKSTEKPNFSSQKQSFESDYFSSQNSSSNNCSSNSEIDSDFLYQSYVQNAMKNKQQKLPIQKQQIFENMSLHNDKIIIKKIRNRLPLFKVTKQIHQ